MFQMAVGCFRWLLCGCGVLLGVYGVFQMPVGWLCMAMGWLWQGLDGQEVV